MPPIPGSRLSVGGMLMASISRLWRLVRWLTAEIRVSENAVVSQHLGVDGGRETMGARQGIGDRGSEKVIGLVDPAAHAPSPDI